MSCTDHWHVAVEHQTASATALMRPLAPLGSDKIIPLCSALALPAVQSVVQALPHVGTKVVSQEEQALRAEDEARRAAWAELNALRAAETEAGARYKKAYAHFVATWGHRGAELRE